MAEKKDKNGLPSNLLPVDSYWNVGAGNMEIPDSIFIEPGKTPPRSVYIIDSANHVTIKSDDYRKGDFDKNTIAEAIRYSLSSIYAATLPNPTSYRRFEWYCNKYSSHPETDQILEDQNPDMSVPEMADKIMRIIYDSEPTSRFSDQYDRINEVRFREYWAGNNNNPMRMLIISSLNEKMLERTMNIAVNETLKHFGYDILVGGSTSVIYDDHTAHYYEKENGEFGQFNSNAFEKKIMEYAYDNNILFDLHLSTLHKSMQHFLNQTDFRKGLNDLKNDLENRLRCRIDLDVLMHDNYINADILFKKEWPVYEKIIEFLKSKYDQEIKKSKSLENAINAINGKNKEKNIDSTPHDSKGIKYEHVIG